MFIDCMTKFGWAYDLKTVLLEIIKRCVERAGDGTHEILGRNDKDAVKVEESPAYIN